MTFPPLHKASSLVPAHHTTHPYLEVVWELCSAGVPGVHGDEDGAGWVQNQLRTLEHEPLQVSANRALYRLNLLCYH